MIQFSASISGRELEERERAGVGQQEQLGVLDDLGGLALADDLHAVGGPVAGVELQGIEAPDRCERAVAARSAARDEEPARVSWRRCARRPAGIKSTGSRVADRRAR